MQMIAWQHKLTGHFRIMQEKNKDEVERLVAQTKKNVSLSSQPRCCSFVLAQVESGLLRNMDIAYQRLTLV